MPDTTKLAYLRALRETGPTTDAERAELEHADNVYGDRWWMAAKERLWYQTADQVAEFFTTHSRWPIPRSDSAVERHLGYWLRNQRSGAVTGKRWMVADRVAYLDEVAPGWNLERGARPRGFSLPKSTSVAREYADFVTANDRWPSRVAGDEVESRLAYWRENQRTRRRAKPGRLDDAWEFLDRHLPGWDSVRTSRSPRRHRATPGGPLDQSSP